MGFSFARVKELRNISWSDSSVVAEQKNIKRCSRLQMKFILRRLLRYKKKYINHKLQENINIYSVF